MIDPISNLLNLIKISLHPEILDKAKLEPFFVSGFNIILAVKLVKNTIQKINFL